MMIQKPLIRLTFVSLLLLMCITALAAGTGSVQADLVDNLFSLTADWNDDGQFSGVDYGVSVSSAGDINQDGFADIIVGAQRYLFDGNRDGAAFLYLGSNGGLSANPHQVLTMNSYGSLFGASVSSAGDVNGDGYDDVLIGSPNHKDLISNEPRGAAYLYYGSPGGLSISPQWTFIGTQKDAQFGYAVSNAGDVNQDGFDDILVGATHHTNPENNEGMVFLFLGSSTGLSSLPDWSFESNQSGAQAGFALASLGDVNGDTIADFAVSTPSYNSETLNDCGIVWIFLGSSDPAGISTIPYWSVTGMQAYEYFGGAVAGAGDVNNDGYLDLIVGARGYDEDEVDVGAAYLFTNSDSGLKSPAAWQVHSSQSMSGYGISVAGLGDVNLDGFADVAVGAHRYTDGQNLEGVVFVYRGSPAGVETSAQWTGGGDKAEASFGFSIANAGDVNLDGKNDLLIGAPDYKRDEKTVMGRASLFHGMQAGEVFNYSIFLPLLATGQ